MILRRLNRWIGYLFLIEGNGKHVQPFLQPIEKMKVSINLVDEHEISEFIEFCVEYFTTLEFRQVHLYSSVSYFINGSNSIALPNNRYLRSNTEPDVWEQPEGDNRFFSISSLFRLEDGTSPLHKQEFKIVDFYSDNFDTNSVVELIKNFAASWELLTESTGLFKPEIVKIDYETFNNGNFDSSSPCIYLVSGYPKEETFFDAVDNTGVPLKSELFFVWKEFSIEFAVIGKVGPNINPINYIADYEFIDKDRNLWGGGIGIERLLLIYRILNSSS